MAPTITSTKPFGLLEFLARLDALLRRRRANPVAAVERLGDIALDLTRRLVQRTGVEVPLRPKEFDAVVARLRRSGHMVTHDVLPREVWAFAESVLSRC